MNEKKDRRRRVLSLLSLLVLFTLLGAWVLLKLTTKQEGELDSISTAQVKITINESAPPPSDQDAASQATATPAPRPAGGGPSIVAEVLGADDGAAQAKANTGGTRPGGAPLAAATAILPTSTAARPSIGLAPPGSSGPTQAAPRASATQGSGSAFVPGASATAPSSQPTAGASATAPSSQPTAGPTSAPTTAPTSAPSAPTATPVVEEVSSPGHHSHLSIVGFVGPGAYDNGGIQVVNSGPVAFNYSVHMTVTGSSTFAAVIKLRIYLRVGTSCNYPGQPPSGDDLLPLTGDQVGTELYVGTFTAGNKIGDPLVLNAGRDLAVATNEILCMEVFFPWGAGNAYQGLSVNGTFFFTAKSPD